MEREKREERDTVWRDTVIRELVESESRETGETIYVAVPQPYTQQEAATDDHGDRLLDSLYPHQCWNQEPVPSDRWSWCFGNCAVEITNSDLRRIVKGNGHQNKIDVVAALEDAMHLFDVAEGRVSE